MDNKSMRAYNKAYRSRTDIQHIPKDFLVNGNPNKTQWKRCNPISPLVYPWYENGLVYDTEIKLLWSDNYLYILFHCQDGKIRGLMKNYNDLVCRDSCVEAFIAPDLDSLSDYYTYEINCCGVMYNRHYNFLDRWEEKWYPAGTLLGRSIQTQTFKSADHPDVKDWTIELAIPFYLFDGLTGKNPNPPEHGTVWRMNLSRCGDKVYKQFGMWSPSRNDSPNFHLPYEFGEVRFIKE